MELGFKSISLQSCAINIYCTEKQRRKRAPVSGEYFDLIGHGRLLFLILWKFCCSNAHTNQQNHMITCHIDVAASLCTSYGGNI